MNHPIIDASSRPAVEHGYRLQWEAAQNAHVLLYPEGMIKLNRSAGEIMQRCDGKATIESIVDDLAAAYAADRARVDADVRGLLNGLAAKRMVDL